jgi:uncharacterized protein with FMN-binding domain
MIKGSRVARAAAILTALAIAAVAPLAAHRSGVYSKPKGLDLSSATYQDGTYTGSADGFRPGIEVEVTVKEGKVASIKVVDHNEVDSRFYALPIKAIPSAIVKKQSTKVDVVSGATSTSYGIMAAVEDALAKAAW